MVKKTERLFAKIPYSCLEAISKRVSKSPYDGHLSTLPTQLINQILYPPPPPRHNTTSMILLASLTLLLTLIDLVDRQTMRPVDTHLTYIFPR